MPQIARRLRTLKSDPRARVAREQFSSIRTLTRQVDELERGRHTLIKAIDRRSLPSKAAAC
jgi:hypothetical protein